MMRNCKYIICSHVINTKVRKYYFYFQALNEGLGEGIFYRGRILLALSMDVYSSPSAIPTDTGSVAAVKVPLTRYCDSTLY